MTRKYICPACGEKTGVNIVYGYPTIEARDARDLGEIILGGCCVGDNDPERGCIKCGHEWHIKRRKPDPLAGYESS